MAQYEAKPRVAFDKGETVIWKRCRRRSVLVPGKMMFYVPATEEKNRNGPNMKQTNMKLLVKCKGSLPSLLLNLMAPSVLSWADQPTNERLLVELIMKESCWHGNPSVYPFNHSEQRFLLEHSLATTTEHWLLELSTWPSGATQFLTDKIHMGRFWIWTPFWMDIGNRRLWCLKNSAPRQIKGSNWKKKKTCDTALVGKRNTKIRLQTIW